MIDRIMRAARDAAAAQPSLCRLPYVPRFELQHVTASVSACQWWGL